MTSARVYICGFLFFWVNTLSRHGTESLKIRCGEKLTRTYIFRGFYTPTIGSRGLYPPGVECEWIFRPPIGGKGTLVFDSFDLERSDNCSKDYLEVRAGRRGDSTVHGRYCGSDIPHVITIENDIYMKFHTNGNDQRLGFKGHYRVGDCFGQYTGLEGQFATPNFPETLGTVYCEWRIVVPEQYRIRLVFKTFYIDGTDKGSCWARSYYTPNSGMVIVRNGLERDDTKTIARYCGQYAPTVLSSSNTLLVTLDKQENAWSKPEHIGFEAFYYAEAPRCEYRINIGQPAPDFRHFYSKSGNITSRNDTDGYPLIYGCTWIINARNNPIKLQFPEFEVVGDTDCKNEYVEVRDGDSESSPLIGYFCEDNPPLNVIVSSGKHLFLKLQSTNQDARFFATYEEGLYRYFNGTEGIISERRIEIQWKAFIEVPRGLLVYLEFPVFHMAERSIDDHLYMCDGTEYTKEGFLASYQDKYAPPVLSKTNVVYISYKKYWTGEGIGADIKYKAVEPSCTTILRAESGFITSDDVLTELKEYPMCEWRVYSYTDPVVILDFVDFDLINSENCKNEYMEISGTYLNSSIENRFCGNEKPKTIIMENVFIKFYPESLNSLSRFNISYRAACEYIFDGANTGIIHIPPPEVQRHFKWTMECLYNVTVDPGNRISLNFTKFNIVSSYYRTDKPTIEVFDLPSRDVVADVPKGSTPSIIVSNSNAITILVRLYTLESQIDIHYSAEPLDSVPLCAAPSNIILTDFDGELTSPLYPDVYPPNQNCIWHIEIHQNLKHLSPVLTFDAFDVGSVHDDGHDCSDSADFVEVYDGLTTLSRLLGRYCGSEVSGEFAVPSGRTLTVLFHSGEEGGGKGFSARYRSDCYRLFEEPTGVFTIGDASNLWRTTLCTYEVRIPGGKGAVFDFTNLGIDIYEHLGVDQPHRLTIKVGKKKDFVAKVWHDYAPVLMVPDDIIYLEYSTTSSRSSVFNVSYYQADVACKKAIGNLELKEFGDARYPGVVQRIAMPEQCEWGLVNRCGGQVKVELRHQYSYFFKRWFGEEPFCRDYVEARNGFAVSANVTEKMCRHFVSHIYGISTTDSVAVKFAAGGKRIFTYFGANYDAYCGGWSTTQSFNSILNESWDNYDVTSLKAPWIAMFWDTTTNVSFCSGVIVSNRFILTSSTCTNEATRRATNKTSWEGVIIRLGNSESDKIEEHEQRVNYNGTFCIPSSDNNLCLVRFDREVIFSDHVIPVCLPHDRVLSMERASEDTYGFTMGWARLTQNSTYQTKLQRIPMQIKNWETCEDRVQDDWSYRKQYFCAGHVDGDDGGDRCYGHDGGPFLKIWRGRWYLYGVVANDWETWGNEGCPRRGKFGWFWRTVKIQNDISSIICS